MGHYENNKPLNCKDRRKRFPIKWHKPDLLQDHRRKLLKTQKYIHRQKNTGHQTGKTIEETYCYTTIQQS